MATEFKVKPFDSEDNEKTNCSEKDVWDTGKNTVS